MQAVNPKHGQISVIPNNFEKYVSFSIGRLKFLDSMQFLACSLDTLVKNLSEQDFKHLANAFPDKEQQKMLIRKGVYPYDYMNSMDRFKKSTLPLQNEFYNKLNEEALSDEDYEHA